MSSWALSQKFCGPMQLFHRKTPAGVFFSVKKKLRNQQKNPSQVALAMASPSHCCVSSLVTSLTAWECASASPRSLASLATKMWAVWGMMSDWNLYWFFFLGGTNQAARFQKIPWEIGCFFLLKFGSLVVKWSDVMVGRCFTLTPTQGGAEGKDFFLTGRDVMMERWDPSNSGVDILAENWWLEEEFSF